MFTQILYHVWGNSYIMFEDIFVYFLKTFLHHVGRYVYGHVYWIGFLFMVNTGMALHIRKRHLTSRVYQITQTHRTNLCYGGSIQMLSDPVRRAVAGAHRVWFHRASFVSSLPFSFLGLLKHIIQQPTLCREAKAIH